MNNLRKFLYGFFIVVLVLPKESNAVRSCLVGDKRNGMLTGYRMYCPHHSSYACATKIYSNIYIEAYSCASQDFCRDESINVKIVCCSTDNCNRSSTISSKSILWKLWSLGALLFFLDVLWING